MLRLTKREVAIISIVLTGFTLFIAPPVWVVFLSAPAALFTTSVVFLGLAAASWTHRHEGPYMPLYFGVAATCFAAAGAAALRFPSLVPAPPLANVDLSERSFQVFSIWITAVFLIMILHSCWANRERS
ncbi:MAG TPA: hypothetical protein VGE53_02545 [Candidatus Paceibacterota bacterium]